MKKQKSRNKGRYQKTGFPSIYASNEEKKGEEYGLQTFKAILNATEFYREERMAQTNRNRMYALGKQPLQQYLDELKIEENFQYVNINYTPTKIMSKFEKIVVDDYQQLKETPKVIAKAYHIQERKERKKSDLKFRMEFKDQIGALEQELGFPIEDQSVKVPDDEDELNLIMSLNSEEREELLVKEMVLKILEDNDIEGKKRTFLSDTFQVNFAGYFHYVDSAGNIKVDFIPQEDAIYPLSRKELMDDLSFAGHATAMTIGDIRTEFNIPPEKEIELYKLARAYRSSYGNYFNIQSTFNNDWRNSPTRPYDDYTVDVFHIWKKNLKNVGYTEGKDSYGQPVFDIERQEVESNSKPTKNRKSNNSQIETSYEGWFAGNLTAPVCLRWDESTNQTRDGKNKEKVLCPYIYFMPDNRGTMAEASAVEKIIPEVQTIDSTALKIKLTLANHPPAGYAVDYEALQDIDLGDGDLEPFEVDGIFQQTGKLYFKRRKEDGSEDRSLPIIPLDINIQNNITTYMSVYNLAQNNIRDILGINSNREGTANLNRVSNGAIQANIAVSQTATYYIYRAFLKSTKELIRHLGIRILDVLRYGNPSRGYLKYLGEENIEFIKSREEVLSSNYVFEYNPQMTKDDEERIMNMVNAAVTARELTIPDALLIMSLKDVDLAEKYMRYLFNKNKKQAKQDSNEAQQVQAQAQGDMAVRVEEAKRETFQIQSALQANEWKIKGENSTEVAILEIAKRVMEARIEGKEVPPEYLHLERLVLDNALIKQEKSLAETEQQLQQEAEQQEIDMVTQKLQQAVNQGDITEEEAYEQMQQMGMGG